MDERTIKRLLIIFVASIIAVFLIKVGLTKTYTALNKVAAEKKRAAAAKRSAPLQTPTPPHATAAEIIEAPAEPGVNEANTLESPAASSMNEAR